MAVLKQSETLVRQQLRNPTVFTEKNVAGQTPLHLCGNWTKGVELLLEAGFSIDETDHSHLTPLHYAISMADGAGAAMTLLKAGSSLTCCDHLHRWSSIFDFALRAGPSSSAKDLSERPLSPNIACLVENIKYRRKKLAVLAEAHLPHSVLRKLCTLGTTIDDTRAHYSWEALEEVGVEIPPSLSTHGISVYHHVRLKSHAMYLYDMGFKNLSEYDRLGRTPLMSIARRFAFGFNREFAADELDLVEWFLLQGANPLQSYHEQNINSIHIAAYYGTVFTGHIAPQEQQILVSQATGDFFKRQWIDPVVLEKLDKSLFSMRILSPLLFLFVQKAAPAITCCDLCRCGCSCNGCTPITAFLKGVIDNHYYWQYNSLDLYQISALLYNWYNAMAAGRISLSSIRQEVERFIAFEKLGLTHTCCKLHLPSSNNTFDHTFDVTNDTFEITTRSGEVVDEIHDEEEELLDQLETMLRQPHSDWWASPSRLDILLDVSVEGPPPTLKWANLWLIQRAYRLDEKACEEIRIAEGLTEEQFWASYWRVPKVRRKIASRDAFEIDYEDELEGTPRQIPIAYLCTRKWTLGDKLEQWIEFRS